MIDPRTGRALAEPLLGFWRAFLAARERPEDTPLCDVFHFSDNAPDATELADLVLAGAKIGTASLFWLYEARCEPVPASGDLSIVTAWDSSPLCIVETTQVAVVPFDRVTAAFAASEGEGDRSLAHWRRVHWDYFGRECQRLGRAPAPEMPVVCENFRVIWRLQDSP